jgi:hypothetical protein
MSRPYGNGGRDALKVGELFGTFACLTTPSQAVGIDGRCRDWTGAAYGPTTTVKAQSRPRTPMAAAKAEVVRKFAAREGIRVRAPVIPRSNASRHGGRTDVSRELDPPC